MDKPTDPQRRLRNAAIIAGCCMAWAAMIAAAGGVWAMFEGVVR